MQLSGYLFHSVFGSGHAAVPTGNLLTQKKVKEMGAAQKQQKQGF